jgi:prevent-host-death family protein
VKINLDRLVRIHQASRVKNTWQLQEAKGQFCSVAERAAGGGPQLVTKHGQPFVYIVGVKAWRKSRRPLKTVQAALRACPADLSKLDLARSREDSRPLSL